MILSRAGKASGVNKYWFNIKDLEDGLMKSADFEKLMVGKILMNNFCYVRMKSLILKKPNLKS